MLTELPVRRGLNQFVKATNLVVLIQLLLLIYLFFLFLLLFLLLLFYQFERSNNLPNFHDTILTPSCQPITTGRKLNNPNRFLVSSDILNIEIVGFKNFPRLIKYLGFNLLMLHKVLLTWLFRYEFLPQEGIIVRKRITTIT